MFFCKKNHLSGQEKYQYIMVERKKKVLFRVMAHKYMLYIGVSW